MGRIKLLDCTLRDGGYLNDWNFGFDVISNIYERLVSSGVDIIEIGFINSSKEVDINKTIFPNSSSVEKIFGSMNKGNSMIVGMIDYDTCPIENIQPCKDSYLDGIRIIFKEHLYIEALEYCTQIKNLGYKVFVQLVSVTTYTQESLLKLINIVNNFKPHVVSMVDTYGLLHQDNLIEIFKFLDENLDKSIAIGYHAHNNFQMGYANGISVLNSEVDREIMIDGTLYGMGKSAGNTPLELLAMYLNDNYNTNYDVGQMLEAIENSIIPIKRTVDWGYKLFYYVSASTKCHPNYVSYFMNKKTLSMKAINELLLSLDDEKKLLYDKDYAEKAYIKYQSNDCIDDKTIEELKKSLFDKEILLLGPGNSIESEKDSIQSYINTNNPIVIAINFIPNNKIDYVVFTNSKRYTNVNRSLFSHSIKTIATSNIVKTKGGFDYQLNYNNLIDKNAEIVDNSLIMMLKLLNKVKVRNVKLAGFDGYTNNTSNYFVTNMEYDFIKDKAENLNQYVRDNIKKLKKYLNISFLTKSLYEE